MKMEALSAWRANMKLQKLLSLVRQAVERYDMIEEGDRIAVGVSGGKDSLTLLWAMKELSRFYPKRFTVCAVCVDLGYENTDFSGIQRYCADLDVELSIVHTQIGKIVLEERKETNPCLCENAKRCAGAGSAASWLQ
jgi:tRNA(Ile)-lysidine synthase TilS/MesJ